MTSSADSLPAAEFSAAFAPFRTYFTTCRTALSNDLLSEMKVYGFGLRNQPDAVVREQVEYSIDAYLSGLEEPDSVPRYLAEAFGALITQHQEIASILRLIARFRQHFTRYGLDAISYGVSNAAGGLQALNRVTDTVALWVADFYHSHLHEDMHRQSDQLRVTQARLAQSLHTSPLATIEWDHQGTIQFWNPSAERIFGWTAAEAIGKNLVTLLVPNTSQTHVNTVLKGLFNSQTAKSQNENITRDGRIITCRWHNTLIRDEEQTIIGAISQGEDVTELLRSEREHAELQQQVIDAQAMALRELSTPLIPLASGVVAMPLIGSIDTTRAQQVLDSLLQGVATEQASIAILDITGVPVVDTRVANVLLQAAQAVKLLGAQVMLTGIRPEVAQTLIGLGVDLSGIITHSTLQSGVSYALARARARTR